MAKDFMSLVNSVTEEPPPAAQRPLSDIVQGVLDQEAPAATQPTPAPEAQRPLSELVDGVLGAEQQPAEPSPELQAFTQRMEDRRRPVGPLPTEELPPPEQYPLAPPAQIPPSAIPPALDRADTEAIPGEAAPSYQVPVPGRAPAPAKTPEQAMAEAEAALAGEPREPGLIKKLAEAVGPATEPFARFGTSFFVKKYRGLKQSAFLPAEIASNAMKKITGDNEVTRAIDDMSARLQEPTRIEKELDAEFQEKLSDKLKRGKIGSAVWQIVGAGGTDMAAGYLQLMMLGSLLKGTKMGKASGTSGLNLIIPGLSKTAGQTLGNAAVRAGYSFLTTPGTASEKAKTGAWTFAFMSTPVLAGKSKILPGVLDLSLNTVLSHMSGAYPEAWAAAKQNAESIGRPELTVPLFAAHGASTFLQDIIGSSQTRYRGPGGKAQFNQASRGLTNKLGQDAKALKPVLDTLRAQEIGKPQPLGKGELFEIPSVKPPPLPGQPPPLPVKPPPLPTKPSLEDTVAKVMESAEAKAPQRAEAREAAEPDLLQTLKKLKPPELRTRAKGLGISSKGTKKALVDRILEAESQAARTAAEQKQLDLIARKLPPPLPGKAKERATQLNLSTKGTDSDVANRVVAEQRIAAKPAEGEKVKPTIAQRPIEDIKAEAKKEGVASFGKKDAVLERMARKKTDIGPSVQDIADAQKAAGEAGFVTMPDKRSFEALRESVGRPLKNLLSIGLRKGGRTPEQNRLINKNTALIQGMRTELGQQKRRLRKTKEWKHLKKTYGDEVVRDLDDAMFGKNLDGFIEKYKGDLAKNSPTIAVAKLLLEADKLRQPVIDSRHITQSQADAIKATGSDYRKVAYLRYTMGDDFAGRVSPERVEAARAELRAGMLDQVDNLQKLLGEGKATRGMVENLSPILRILEEGGSIKVMENMEAINRAAAEQVDYFLTRKRPPKTGGARGLPIQHLMRRHLEGAFKELYEPLTDPLDVALLSTEAVQHMAIQNAFLTEMFEIGNARVTKSGEVKGFFSMPQEKGGPGPLKSDWKPLEGKQWGNLEGGFVTPELAKVLMPKQGTGFTRGYLRALGTMRFSKLINFVTVGRNKVTSFQFMLSTGDLVRFGKARRGFKWYHKLVKGVKAGDPGAIKEWRGLVESDVLNPRQSSISQDMAFDLASRTSATGLIRKFDQLMERGGDMYAAIDFQAKAVSYNIQRQRGKSHAEAVEHVRQHFQSQTSAPDIAKVLSKSPVTDFIGYQIDSVRMRVNNLKYAINSMGKGDFIPMAGFLAASALEIVAWNEARKGMTKLAANIHNITRKFLGDNPNEKIEIANTKQIQAARRLMPKYYQDSAYMMWFDGTGRPYVLVADPISGYPLEMAMAGAIQIAKEEGLAEGSKAFGRSITEKFKANMLMNTASKEFFGLDINSGTDRGTGLLKVINDDQIKAGDKLRAARNAGVGIFGEYVPGGLLKLGMKIHTYMEEEKKGILLKDSRGESIRRTPIELLLSKISFVRPLPIDMERVMIWSGFRIQERIRDIKSDIGRLNNKENKAGGLRVDEITSRARLLDELSEKYAQVDAFVADWDIVNKSLDEDQRDELLTKVFGRAYAVGGSEEAFEDYTTRQDDKKFKLSR